jgi:hypothetical protein
VVGQDDKMRVGQGRERAPEVLDVSQSTKRLLAHE